MFASIRKYKTKSPQEISRKVKAEFVPLISKAPGFVGYFAVDTGDGTFATVSFFDSRQGAEESNRTSAKWTKENLASLITSGPEISTGEVVAHKMMTLENSAR